MKERSAVRVALAATWNKVRYRCYCLNDGSERQKRLKTRTLEVIANLQPIMSNTDCFKFNGKRITWQSQLASLLVQQCHSCLDTKGLSQH